MHYDATIASLPFSNIMKPSTAMNSLDISMIKYQ